MAVSGKFHATFQAGNDIQMNNKPIKTVSTGCVYSSTLIPVAASASAVTVPIALSPTNPIYFLQDTGDSGTLTVSVTIGGVARTLKVQPILVLSDAVTAITVSNSSSTTAQTLKFIIFGSSS